MPKSLFIKIYRPINGLFLLFSQCWLAFFYSHEISLPVVLWALGVVAIATGGYLQNYKDDEPSNTFNRSSLPWFFTGIICLSVISFFTHQWLFFGSGVLASIMLFYYSPHLKKHGLLGNLAVAMLAAWSLIGLALLLIFTTSNVQVSSLLLLAFLSFLSTLNREWMKDMEDMNEDRQLNRNTLPLKLGKHFTFACHTAVSIPIGIYLCWIAPSQNLVLAVSLFILGFTWILCALLIWFQPAKIRSYQQFIKLFQFIVLLLWPFLRIPMG